MTGSVHSRVWPRVMALCLALLWAGLTVTGAASAAPVVRVRITPIPIPGVPGTGDILGAGVAVEDQVTISGSEYGGSPSPLTGINVYAPVGVKVSPTGFATCAPTVLEASGPVGCPRRSSAGPPGVGLGYVSFGNERVPEAVAIREFFAPDGGLTFYVEGNTPSSFQVLERAHWIMSSPPFGPEAIVEVPLVETLPGADDASVTSFDVKIGAAYRKDGKTISYITQPRKCPPDGFPVKSELKFLSGEAVTVSEIVPCPRGARKPR
jgi:hypothetical protein